MEVQMEFVLNGSSNGSLLNGSLNDGSSIDGS